MIESPQQKTYSRKFVFSKKDHTFAICAYKKSPYLKECVDSLVSQTASTNIIMTTSTPNDYIKELAGQYNIPLFLNDNSDGIASDWNFACSQAGTPLVTIAHQDDVYCKEYAEQALSKINAALNPLVYFTDYGELRAGVRVDENRLLRVKRKLLMPLESVARQNSVFWRRRVLSFGSAICCPSVTLVQEALPETLFVKGLETNLDWDAWERFSLLEGAFVYNKNILMYHRIHQESATTALIEAEGRDREDELLLRRFWPQPVARLINFFYARSQKSNTIDG